MKRTKFRVETSSAWTDEQMLEEIKKSIPDFKNKGEKEEAIIIVSIRKVPNKYMR